MVIFWRHVAESCELLYANLPLLKEEDNQVLKVVDVPHAQFVS